MTTYKLASMKLQNFCGITSLEISPNGENITVYGDNATGKTTLANAFAWLFTGKNAAGTADFDPMPLDGENQKIHNLETAVEARFTNGSTYRRVLAEVWTKKRGDTTAQLTGTKTSYFKDGVPLKEKEFNADVDENIGGGETFRMLTAAGYFAGATDWKTRRKILLDMCGNVGDSDVIMACAELTELPKILCGHTVEEYLKIIKLRKTELRRELDTIPARISENQNALSDVPSEKLAEEKKAELTALSEELKKTQDEIARYSAPTAAEERRNALLREIERMRTEYLSDYNIRLSDYNKRLSAAVERRDGIYSERSPLIVKESSLPHEISDMKKRREQLVAEHKQVTNQTYDGGDTCPCCGQKLPQERIENAVAEFNRRKSEKLTAISEKARTTCHRDMIAALEAKLDEVSKQVAKLDEQYNSAESEISEIKNGKPENNFEATREYKDLAAQIAEIKPENVQTPSELLTKEAELKERISEDEELICRFNSSKNIFARIAELEEQQRKYAAEYAAAEKGEYLCAKFTEVKISLLDERINSRFTTLKFKLFHEQQNGGLQEMCKVLIPCESGLVEYEKANNAARINAGIEIINTLSDYFGITLPVFCDNAESVTELLPANGQEIKLVVSAEDKRLRCELNFEEDKDNG